MRGRKIINRLRFGRSRGGRYRFAVRNWSGIDDIQIIAETLGTETYRSYIRPRALSLDEANSILVLAPHQDDELMGAGGLMLKAKNPSKKLTILFLTDGAMNNLVINGKKLSPSEIVAIREEESVAVCNRLGAEHKTLGIDNVSMNVATDHVARLRHVLAETGADLVLLPWLFDGSPKHRVASQLLYHALSPDLAGVQEVWGYQVNNTPFANGYLDITEEIQAKIDLLDLYKSQIEGLRPYDHLARGLNAWNSRFLPSKHSEGKAQYAEIFFTVPAVEFRDLVKRHYFADIQRTYLGNKDLADRMLRLAQNL